MARSRSILYPLTVADINYLIIKIASGHPTCVENRGIELENCGPKISNKHVILCHGGINTYSFTATVAVGALNFTYNYYFCAIFKIIKMDELQKIDVSEVRASYQHFMWIDYLVFVFMLTICGAIGVYFGFIKKQTSAQDYLMGGRNMSLTPVTFSLVAR